MELRRNWFSTNRRNGKTIRRTPTRLGVLGLEDRVTPTAGILDPTFGVGGRTTVDFGSLVVSPGQKPIPTDDYAYAVAVAQPDGKVLVGGRTDASSNRGAQMVRLNADGSPDAMFGTEGRVFIPNAGEVRSINVRPDGKVLVCTQSYLLRLNTDGSFDGTFGGGSVTIPFNGFGGAAYAGAVVQSDGRIVVGGYQFNGITQYDFVLARYNTDGTSDVGFDGPGDSEGDGDGVRSYDFGVSGYDIAQSLALGPGDSLALAGYSSDGFTDSPAVARLDADGNPLSSFNGNGRFVWTSFGYSYAYSVAVQPDGAVVVVGSFDGDSNNFSVRRLNAAGQPDVTFGSGGARSIDISGGYDQAYTVAVRPDDSIVVGGWAYGGAARNEFALVRLDSSGNLDPSFGYHGIATTGFSSANDDYAFAIALDGTRTIAAGISRDFATRDRADFAVARLDNSGGLDSSFGTGGRVLMDIGLLAISPHDFAYSVAVTQPDGKVIVAGYSYNNSTGNGGSVARLDTDGSLDPTFGAGGRVFLPGNHINSLLIQPDGKIVVDQYDRLVRLNGNGSVDGSFGGGTVSLLIPATAGAVQQSDGRIVVGGYRYNAASLDDFALVRYNPDGSPDLDFDGLGDPEGDGDGVRSYDFGAGQYDYPRDLVLGPSDSLALAGYSYSIYDFTTSWAVARLDAEGAPLASFDDDGLQTVLSVGGYAYAYSVAVLPDGAVVLAGYDNSRSDDMAVSRLSADGQTDLTFGPGGHRFIDFSGDYDWATCLAVQPDGRIIVGGGSGSDHGSVWEFALARLNTDGTYDNSFGTAGRVTTSFTGWDDGIEAIVVDGNRLVVAGYAATAQVAGRSYYDFAVARYIIGQEEPAVTATDAAVSNGLPLYGVDSVTLSATVTVVSPGTGTPTGTVSFYDGPTLLGTANLVDGIATLPLGPNDLAVGPHDIRAVYDGDATFAGGEDVTSLTVVAPSSVHGLVYVDFNNDGEVNFNERVIEGATITLTGIDDLGQPVNLTTLTDENGVYLFDNLRPSNAAGYTITQTQPAGFTDGRDTLGLVDGSILGSDAVNDAFSGIVLSSNGSVAENYNFGERPASTGSVGAGQTATIGYWQNKNGQNLIKALNGGATATQLGTWLATTFPNMYASLDGLTNSEVALHYKSLFGRNAQSSPGGPPKADAQVMATALAVYATNQSLAGNTATAFGFQVTLHGVGASSFNVGNNGAAFGVANGASLSVMDLLLAVNNQSTGGVLYGGNASLRTMANNVFTLINESGGI